MRVTLDTNILVSSMLWDYSTAHKLIISLKEREAKMFTSRQILEEFGNILAREFNYNKTQIEETLNFALTFAEVIETSETINIIDKDPSDNKIVECAVASESNYILSYDKHLLELREFRKIRILTPEELSNIFNNS